MQASFFTHELRVRTITRFSPQPDYFSTWMAG